MDGTAGRLLGWEQAVVDGSHTDPQHRAFPALDMVHVHAWGGVEPIPIALAEVPAAGTEVFGDLPGAMAALGCAAPAGWLALPVHPAVAVALGRPAACCVHHAQEQQEHGQRGLAVALGLRWGAHVVLGHPLHPPERIALASGQCVTLPVRVDGSSWSGHLARAAGLASRVQAVSPASLHLQRALGSLWRSAGALGLVCALWEDPEAALPGERLLPVATLFEPDAQGRPRVRAEADALTPGDRVGFFRAGPPTCWRPCCPRPARGYCWTRAPSTCCCACGAAASAASSCATWAPSKSWTEALVIAPAGRVSTPASCTSTWPSCCGSSS